MLSLSGGNEEETNGSSANKIHSPIINSIIRTSNIYYVLAVCGGIIFITALLGLLIRFKRHGMPDGNNERMSFNSTGEQLNMQLLNTPQPSNSPRR